MRRGEEGGTFPRFVRGMVVPVHPPWMSGLYCLRKLCTVCDPSPVKSSPPVWCDTPRNSAAHTDKERESASSAAEQCETANKSNKKEAKTKLSVWSLSEGTLTDVHMYSNNT